MPKKKTPKTIVKPKRSELFGRVASILEQARSGIVRSANSGSVGYCFRSEGNYPHLNITNKKVFTMCGTKAFFSFFIFVALSTVSYSVAQTYGERDAVLLEEFVFQSAPFPSCHAVSLVETSHGTLRAAWFGGYAESHKRVGIWTAKKENGKWLPPIEVANGLQEDGNYLPCWNPVLFQPQAGPLTLYFKVGPNPADWWGEMMISENDGTTWKNRKRLPNNCIGPVRCKPVEMVDGHILCPSSDEKGGVWQSHIEITDAKGEKWGRSAPLHTKEEAQTIQPTLMLFKDRRILMLCRDRNGNGNIWQCWSDDNGKSWGQFSPTALPNPNAGVDGLTLNDGRLLLIYNHTQRESENPDVPTGRTMLNLAVSDDGKTWKAACVFENTPKAEFSYPAIIQTKDGLVHIAYTWKRQLMKHVVLDPKKIHGISMKDGLWP